MMREKEYGFTLVELAISLVIIGLLLGGILKGQELYANSAVSAATRQAQIYDSAMVTFHDTYAALPGDIRDPAVRIPRCAAAPCTTVGDGDGIIGGVVADPTTAFPTGDATENRVFWNHLAMARLIEGVSSGNPANALNVWGLQYPKARIGPVGFQIAYYNSGDPTGTTTNGHYLMLRGGSVASGTAMASTTRALTAQQARNFDAKIDNGQPYSGKVIGVGAASGAMPVCASVSGGNVVYDGNTETPACNMLIKTQF